MEKTYAETQGFAPFDWNKFLDRAITEEITEEVYEAVEKLASNWTTCPCSAQSSIIPRFHGRPRDGILTGWGYEFYYSISRRDFRTARFDLESIEARSSILIAEELRSENEQRQTSVE